MNDNIKQYERELTWDEPILYLPLNLVSRREFLLSEISKLKQKQGLLSIEESLNLKLFQDEYNNQELLIYPISMYYYIDFFMAINCLLINKNQIPDPKIISMSYLDFLICLIESSPEGQLYASMLVKILEMSLKIDTKEIKLLKNKQGKSSLSISIKSMVKDEEVINTVIIDANDFNTIKDIICFQNVPYYDDSYIDPDLENALKETSEFKSKNSKKRGSLEDQIVCVTISTFCTIEDIKNLTIRKFTKILERVDYKLHYQIYKNAEMGGNVTFKTEIDHWMSDLTPDKFAGNTTEFEQLQDKINGANG